MPTERTEWESSVLNNFLDEDRLKRLPAKLKKRRVILQWLVEKFEPDKEYPQAEINHILSRYHPDVATIRREFIEYGFMQRSDSVYRRTVG
jgi:hypothetical protein